MAPAQQAAWILALLKQYPDPPRPIDLKEVFRFVVNAEVFSHSGEVYGLRRLILAPIVIGWILTWGGGRWINYGQAYIAVGLFFIIMNIVWLLCTTWEMYRLMQTAVRGTLHLQQVVFHPAIPSKALLISETDIDRKVIHWQVQTATQVFDQGPIWITPNSYMWPWVLGPGVQLPAVIDLRQQAVWHIFAPLPATESVFGQDIESNNTQTH